MQKRRKNMKIISLDASTTCTGYAIFDECKLVDFGCFDLKKSKDDWRARTKEMIKNLEMLIKRSHPDKIFIEDVPLNSRNPQTLFMLGVLQGAIFALCVKEKIDIEFIGVGSWRSTLGLFDGTNDIADAINIGWSQIYQDKEKHFGRKVKL